MFDANWHQPTLDALHAQLQSDPSVIALAVLGSALDPARVDAWSDLDVLVVVTPDALERYSDAAWLGFLGERFALEQYHSAHDALLRIVLMDMRRLDVIITTDAYLAEIGQSAWRGVRLIFSRSPMIEEVLAREIDPHVPPVFTPEQFTSIVDQFWFRSIIAVQKIARDDLLIGYHLALEMGQDCLVLTMILRDRAEGTNIHRTGGAWNDLVRPLDLSDAPPTREGILVMIERAAHAFDDLAQQWSPDYQPRSAPLLEHIEQTRKGR